MLAYGANKELADLLLRESCGRYPVDLGNEVSREEASDELQGQRAGLL